MAFDTVLGRNCAIKCLHEKNRGEKQILRFQREARASSRLKHPGIAEIFDFGIAEDGAPFLVMEYVEGVSLLSYLEGNSRLPLKQALHIVSLIADAMSHAHSKSVIHRDLKPSNIILTGLNSTSEELNVKIVDFGIAALIEDEAVGKTMTPTHGLTGSPYYMSPEQARRIDIDTRTDIYSLGCMLYELLTAEKPYGGETALLTIEMHLHAEVPLAHLVAPDLQIPEHISRLAERMMAKSKFDRVPTMTDVAALLKSSEPSRPVVVETQSKSTRAIPVKQLIKRYSRKTLLALILIVAVGGFAAPYLVTEMVKPMLSIPEQKPVPLSNESETDFQSLGKMVGLTEKKSDAICTKQYHLNGEAVTDATLKGILMSGGESPTDIIISRTGITRESLKLIAACPTIQTLHLDYCQKFPESALVELIRMKKLRMISLRGSNVSEKALDILAKIPSVEIIVLSDNPKVTISGVLKLARLPNLYSLGLGNTSVKGTDFLSLNEFKHLIVVTFDHADVSDEDLVCIGKLKFLQCISLTDSKLSESGILPLAEIPNLHTIRMADCKGPSIKTMFILKNKIRRRCLIEEKRPYSEDQRLYKR